jgi:hypothetical protein
MPEFPLYLSRFDPRSAISKLALPTIEMPSVDLGKAIAGVREAAHVPSRVQERRLPRWPFAAAGGMLVAGLTGWVVLSNRTVRARLASWAEPIRERISALRSVTFNRARTDQQVLLAADSVAMEPAPFAPFADDATLAATGSTADIVALDDDVAVAVDEGVSPA